MINEKEHIINFLNENKKKLSEQFGIIRIGLFGSYYNNVQTEKSDIDVLINVKMDFKKYKYYFELKRFLEDNLGKKVDIVYEDVVNPLIKMEIQNDIIYV
ncbi:MAG: nucleotidyltransferase domain-containing protein [Bacteroidota bacterium]|nr:nucleotidyltransferase domain-containing protein [Bacteroidota bacterium]